MLTTVPEYQVELTKAIFPEAGAMLDDVKTGRFYGEWADHLDPARNLGLKNEARYDGRSWK